VSNDKQDLKSPSQESAFDECIPFDRIPPHRQTASKAGKGARNTSASVSEIAVQGTPAHSCSKRIIRGDQTVEKEPRGLKVSEVDRGSPQLERLSPNTRLERTRDAAVLEITPDTIATLARESLKENVHFPLRPDEQVSGRHHKSPPMMSRMDDRVDRMVSSTISDPGIPRLGSGRQVVQGQAREPWQTQKAALQEKFKEGWNPRKRLSPDALAGIRAIHAQFPEQYTTRVLAEKFEVSPEAIRRILKSKWTPKEDEELDRKQRWFARGQKVWHRYAELGVKPPVRWRKLGIGQRDGAPTRIERRPTGKVNVTERSVKLSYDSANGIAPSVSLAERIL